MSPASVIVVVIPVVMVMVMIVVVVVVRALTGPVSALSTAWLAVVTAASAVHE